jgi:hypothetical protein
MQDLSPRRIRKRLEYQIHISILSKIPNDVKRNAALGSFQTLFQTQAAGTVMPTCTLSTVASNGDAVQFVMKSVQIKSVSAMSSAASVAAPATSFVNAVLGFASVTVVDTGGGADDGGASPIGGYDVATNKKV